MAWAHTAMARTLSINGPRRRSRSTKTSDRSGSDVRNAFTGASDGAGRWSATRNQASRIADDADRPPATVAAAAPGNQCATTHAHGNPQPARPTLTGTGTGSGSFGAITGNHRVSWSIRAAAA